MHVRMYCFEDSMGWHRIHIVLKFDQGNVFAERIQLFRAIAPFQDINFTYQGKFQAVIHNSGVVGNWEPSRALVHELMMLDLTPDEQIIWSGK